MRYYLFTVSYSGEEDIFELYLGVFDNLISARVEAGIDDDCYLVTINPVTHELERYADAVVDRYDVTRTEQFCIYSWRLESNAERIECYQEHKICITGWRNTGYEDWEWVLVADGTVPSHE